jgi:hypothetical protein
MNDEEAEALLRKYAIRVEAIAPEMVRFYPGQTHQLTTPYKQEDVLTDLIDALEFLELRDMPLVYGVPDCSALAGVR